MIPVQDNKANLYVCLSQFKTIGFFILLLVFGKKGFFWVYLNVYNLQKKKTWTCIVLDIATVQTRRIYPNHIKEYV
jgi:hypothetical protein